MEAAWLAVFEISRIYSVSVIIYELDGSPNFQSQGGTLNHDLKDGLSAIRGAELRLGFEGTLASMVVIT